MGMSEQQSTEDVPPAIRGDAVAAKLLREFIWRPAARKNDWRVFVIVGREGSGKSLTCASILRAVDPSFTVDRAHFEAVPFFEDISRDCDQPGEASMLDEAGVAFGNRTWHDREQVEANQALQTARDDNRIIGLTLPRLKELDVQLKGRIHLLFETSKTKDGEWVQLRPYVIDPTRKGRDKVYKKHPKVWAGGRKRKIESFKVGPPDQEFVNNYEPKKEAFKDELYDDVIDKYNGEEGDDGEESDSPTQPKEIAEDVIENDDVEKYTSQYNNREFVDDDLIAVDYEVGGSRAEKAKKLIEREAL